MKPNVEAGRRVFTFGDQMLASAKLGSTLALSVATVAGIDGDDIVIEGHERPAYRVHPGYVIVAPDAPHLRPGDAVITEHDGWMKHAVFLRVVKESAVVRYTDVPGRAVEAQLLLTPSVRHQGAPLKAARFIRQVEGLAAGNYAALRRESDWAHVLLVSSSGEGPSRRWFALGFGGAAMVVAESDLVAIPVHFRPKLGAAVFAESGGLLRRATVSALDEPGLFTVKFERAGRPSTVGWGLIMPPPGPG